jgi:hypothetical protein
MLSQIMNFQYNTKTKGISNIPKKNKNALLCYVQNGQNDIETWPAIGKAVKAQKCGGNGVCNFFFFNI